jgi:hypothetical protein
MPKVVLQLVAGEFAVGRLPATEPVPSWAGSTIFSSVTRTADELSIVCPTVQVPTGIKAERGWRLLKFRGPLDFGAVGILAAVTAPLAQAGISLLAVGTFDTDYVLVRSDRLDEVARALAATGHTVHR